MTTPTYANIGDHSEAVRIEYDPTVITYEELLKIFWQSHDPRAKPWLRQYRNAIFTLNEEQKRAAEASRDRLARQNWWSVHTAIESATPFIRAEERHQKRFLRQAKGLFEEVASNYNGMDDLIDSIIATRLNSYLDCAGNLVTLREEIDQFGLSAGRRNQLLAYVEKVCISNSGLTCDVPNR